MITGEALRSKEVVGLSVALAAASAVAAESAPAQQEAVNPEAHIRTLGSLGLEETPGSLLTSGQSTLELSSGPKGAKDEYAPDQECIQTAFNTGPTLAQSKYVGKVGKKREKVRYSITMPALSVNGQPCDEQRIVYIGGNVKRFGTHSLFNPKKYNTNEAIQDRGVIKTPHRLCGWVQPKNAAEEKTYKIDKQNKSKGWLDVAVIVKDDQGNYIGNHKGARTKNYESARKKVCDPHLSFQIKNAK